jgi:hypothetical protein
MKMEWNGHVTGMGGIRYAYKISVAKPEEKNLLEDHGVDRKIFKHIYKKQGGIM